MEKKPRYNISADSSDYNRGFAEGLRAAYEESELDAYYTGVGYGKKASGEKHIGFSSDDERQEFEKGVSHSHKHFRAYRAEPLTFWERLFGKKESRRDTVNVSDRRSAARQKVARTAASRSKEQAHRGSRSTKKKQRRK